MREASHPLLELTLARLREFWRDPSALFWTFGFPVILAVALGIAFRESPEHTMSVGVAAQAPGAAEVVELFEAVPQIEARTVDPARSSRDLASGKLDLLIVPARDEAAWVFRYDPYRAESREARLAVDAALQRARGRVDVLATADESLGERGGRYIDFLIPGLIGLNIMGSAIWGIGFSVVDARKRKLLKRLAATPMSRAHFLLAYMFSRLVFLAAEVAVLVGFGWLVFGVAVHGSVLALALVSIYGSLVLTGIAMLIAARPRSTETASGWANLFMLPMWLLSGVFFTYERFPEATHVFIRALPLTALNDSLRAIMNEGGALVDVVPELGVLALWGTFSFALALKIFRWQ
jgi:ABC-2 type transport system permease protein